RTRNRELLAARRHAPAKMRVLGDRVGIVQAGTESGRVELFEAATERTLVVVEQRHRAADSFNGGVGIAMGNREVPRVTARNGGEVEAVAGAEEVRVRDGYVAHQACGAAGVPDTDLELARVALLDIEENVHFIDGTWHRRRLHLHGFDERQPLDTCL